MAVSRYLSCFIMAAMAAIVSANVTTLPPQIIQQTNGDGVCPSDAEIQNYLSIIQDEVRSSLRDQFGPPPPPACGDPSVWTQVAFINMSDTNTTCPDELAFAQHGTLRACGRPDILDQDSCVPITINVTGQYSQVCGRIRGYQAGQASAFFAASDGTRTLYDQYLDGVSLTYQDDEGFRVHIWSFAVGSTEDTNSTFDESSLCPCDAPEDDPKAPTSPHFVGDSYFCESGQNDAFNQYAGSDTLYPDDPLWDGDNCIEGSRCCSFNSPPYFTKELSAPTTSSIEFRYCLGEDSKNANLLLDLVELYVIPSAP